VVRSSFLWMVGLGWAALLAARPAAAQGMRIEDAVRLALSKNERARQAELRVEAAEGGLERARSQFLPTLTASGDVSRTVLPTDQDEGWGLRGQLRLSQPIIDPTSWPSYAQARHNLAAEREGSTQDMRVLGFDAARAFLQALANEQVLVAARSRLDRAQANLDDARARAEAGLASTNDGTRAALDVASAARDVAQQRGSVQRAYLNLALIVGQTVNGPLAPPSGAARIEALMARGSEALVRSAPDRRADVRALHARADALRSSADEPYYRLAPSLSATATATGTPDPSPQQSGYDVALGLGLTWQIFDAARYADMKQRSAQAADARLEEGLKRRTAITDVRAAIVSFNTARATFRIAEDALAAARQNSEETTVLYRQGLARSIELSDANSRLFEAEVTVVSSRLSLEQACIELRYALGLEPIEVIRGAGR
jgi:outer membrane protein TolC